MRRVHLSFAILIAAQLAALTAAPAAARSVQESAGWEFNLVPYLWMAGSSTRLAHPAFPLAVEADSSFGDILGNLDFGAMVAFEARRGRWGLLLDGLYVKVSEDGMVAIPQLGGARLPVAVGVRSFTGLAGVQYRLVADGIGSLDLVAGPRFWSLGSSINAAFPSGTPLPPGVPPSYSRRETVDWVDAMAGAKAVVNLAPRITLNAHAMFGAGGSRFSSDSLLAVGFRAGRSTSLLAGYRHLSAEVHRSNGLDVDTRMHGPAVGASIRF
ncbi:hypothetical protein L6Q21_08270 [Sandaracinobacter sp. RS1-74]|uniref:hypothetical protein n=1 Tax=Sandaracinobacteroides sayramensis TaxID=2913411 RepID=UPI001EDC17A8|nr:hypothetical protein [Sandaracinobacteroides sayramensis]MCG2840975.1 hypothetical protein [Sandaracinobacteroides sayramensis]